MQRLAQRDRLQPQGLDIGTGLFERQDWEVGAEQDLVLPEPARPLKRSGYFCTASTTNS